MPNMKYFQTISDMRNGYENRLGILQRAGDKPHVLEAYELNRLSKGCIMLQPFLHSSRPEAEHIGSASLNHEYIL